MIDLLDSFKNHLHYGGEHCDALLFHTMMHDALALPMVKVLDDIEAHAKKTLEYVEKLRKERK